MFHLHYSGVHLCEIFKNRKLEDPKRKEVSLFNKISRDAGDTKIIRR